MDEVWVFNGDGGTFPAGVFSRRAGGVVDRRAPAERVPHAIPLGRAFVRVGDGPRALQAVSVARPSLSSSGSVLPTWSITITTPARAKGEVLLSRTAGRGTIRDAVTVDPLTSVDGFRTGGAVVISSRTPEGWPNHCPVCGSDLKIEPSDPARDAPCPRCGHLLWFAWEDLGDVQVITPTGSPLDPESLDRLFDSVARRSGQHLVIDLSNVQYLPSSILGKLINLKKQLGGRASWFCMSIPT